MRNTPKDKTPADKWLVRGRSDARTTLKPGEWQSAQKPEPTKLAPGNWLSSGRPTRESTTFGSSAGTNLQARTNSTRTRGKAKPKTS